FLRRYWAIGDVQDLNFALIQLEQAVDATPAGSPDLPSLLNNLGTGLSTRFGRTGSIDDLEEAIRCYRKACDFGATAAPQAVLDAAHNWGRWAVQRQAWDEAVEAYSHGFAAGRNLRNRQLRRADKESWLADMQEMAPAIAYAQVQRGNLASAVTFLEAGRATLLAEQLEQNRRDLERLPELGYPALYDRLQTVLAERRRLEQPDTVIPDRVAAVALVDQNFDAVVAAIRCIPGYTNFLAERTFDEIQAVAQDSPLVYIVATSVGGLALLVYHNSVQAISLDKLTAAELSRVVLRPADEPALVGGYLGAYARWRSDHTHDPVLRATWHETLDNTTAWLWETVMAPVVASLTQAGVSEAVLITSGLLGLLPLHTAWTHDASMPAGRRYALDSVTFRYAPSATALAASLAQSRHITADGILAVDNPDGTLTFSKQEVTAVVSHFPARSLHLAGTSVTLDAIQKELAAWPVLHFSTHWQAGWNAPLEGNLLLGGGTQLTFSLLFDLKLPATRLA
ncbi:MAG: CHAT domain-containing protein, partial [Caldilinea sp.]